MPSFFYVSRCIELDVIYIQKCQRKWSIYYGQCFFRDTDFLSNICSLQKRAVNVSLTPTGIDILLPIQEYLTQNKSNPRHPNMCVETSWHLASTGIPISVNVVSNWEYAEFCDSHHSWLSPFLPLHRRVTARILWITDENRTQAADGFALFAIVGFKIDGHGIDCEVGICSTSHHSLECCLCIWLLYNMYALYLTIPQCTFHSNLLLGFMPSC